MFGPCNRVANHMQYYLLLVCHVQDLQLHGLLLRKKFRVRDIGKYPLIQPHIPNIGFVEQKQPWVLAAEFYDSMLVKRVSIGGIKHLLYIPAVNSKLSIYGTKN